MQPFVHKITADPFSTTNEAHALNQQAIELAENHRHQKALALFDRALLLHTDPMLHFNRANTLVRLHQWSQAIDAYEQAIAGRADFLDAYWNLSHLLLMLGDYSTGFQLFESGWGNQQRRMHHPHHAPLWQGETDVRGKRILLHSEQGLGDTIEFCRYAKVLQQAGAHVILQVQASLVSLLQSLNDNSDLPHFAPIQIISTGQTDDDCDYQCPLMSLPHTCHTTLETIPFKRAYLIPSNDAIEKWDRILGARKKPLIGLAWRGNPNFPQEAQRRIDLSLWINHLNPEFDYVCLQPDLTLAEKQWVHQSGIIDHGELIDDFSDTAALMMHTDLVISSCTSVAHLSAAIGHPTWITLGYTADWRWLIDRDDSPWYESVKLWRQSHEGDWDAVLKRIQEALPQFIASITKP
jgi:hypothetical protein